ncbi:MAG: hypothetical protein GY846_23310 [Deltaproteobacteria bacterium]|nr:hypothetical protein [Deltaproteobacteria bacterium]
MNRSIIYFMEGGEPLPWWSFTDERKKKCGALQPLHGCP